MKKILTSALALGIALQSGAGIFTLQAKETTIVGTVSKETQEVSFQKIKSNFKEYVAGNELMNAETALSAKVNACEKAADAAFQAYVGNPTMLFTGLDLSKAETVEKNNSDNLSKTSQNIYKMALGYATSGTKYYQDPKSAATICEAIQLFYKDTFRNYQTYSDDGLLFGNWYNWEIGIPTQLSNTFVLMETELNNLDKDLIQNYVTCFDNYLRWGKHGDVDLSARQHTGANLVDITTNRILQGSLTQDGARVEKAVENMMTVFATIDPYQLVNRNTDGVYEDGSFIQHHRVAYTGSYGKVLLQRAMQSLIILDQTPWVPTSQVETLQSWIYHSFAPLMYEGYMMEIVKGRAVSRTGTGYADSTGIIESMVLLSKYLPEAQRVNMAAQIKYMVASMPSTFQVNSLGFAAIKPYLEIANDASIQPASSLGKGIYAFNAMDKNVQIGDGFAFALSRSSNRISKYEYMSGENLKPWFQGDGAFYLYLSGRDQSKSYGINYMASIDPYRLPGTTVPNEKRLTIPELYDGKLFYPGYASGSEEQNDYVYFPVGTNTFSGSVVLGQNSVAGMQLGDDNAYDAKSKGLLSEDFVAYKNADANKSWFMFDGAIVVVGSDIRDALGRSVTTTIDNRMADVSEKISLSAMDANGKEIALENGNYDALSWIQFQTSEDHTSIGYVFPEKQPIQVQTETRTGNIKDVRSVSPSKEVKQQFFTLTYEHGADPKGAQYSYIMLPNADRAKVEAFAKNSDIQILENSASVHAVESKQQQLVGFNFFKAGKSNGIETGSAASIMRQLTETGMTLAVSDPTFKQEEMVVYVDGSYQSNQDGVIATRQDGRTKLVINTHQLYGKSIAIDLQPVKEEQGGDTKPDVKPEDKPEVKPEEKPEVKPEVKPEDKTPSDKTVDTSDQTQKAIWFGSCVVAIALLGLGMRTMRKHKK